MNTLDLITAEIAELMPIVKPDNPLHLLNNLNEVLVDFKNPKIENNYMQCNLYNPSGDLKIQAFNVFKGNVFIGKNVTIGSFNLIRGPVFLGDNVIIGSYNDISNSIICSGSGIYHKNSLLCSVAGTGLWAVGVDSYNMKPNGSTIIMRWDDEAVELDNNVKFGVTIGSNSSLTCRVLTMPGAFVPPNSTIIGPCVITNKGEVKKFIK